MEGNNNEYLLIHCSYKHDVFQYITGNKYCGTIIVSGGPLVVGNPCTRIDMYIPRTLYKHLF